MLQDLLYLDQVLVLVDSANFCSDMYESKIAKCQLTMADTLLLSKTDLVSEANVRKVIASLMHIRPNARILKSRKGRIPIDLILDVGTSLSALQIQKEEEERRDDAAELLNSDSSPFIISPELKNLIDDPSLAGMKPSATTLKLHAAARQRRVAEGTAEWRTSPEVYKTPSTSRTTTRESVVAAAATIAGERVKSNGNESVLNSLERMHSQGIGRLDGFQSISFRSKYSIDRDSFTTMTQYLCDPVSGVYRAKGLLGFIDRLDTRFIIHVAGRRVDEEEMSWDAQTWKEGVDNVFVVIGKGLNRKALEELWHQGTVCHNAEEEDIGCNYFDSLD